MKRRCFAAFVALALLLAPLAMAEDHIFPEETPIELGEIDLYDPAVNADAPDGGALPPSEGLALSDSKLTLGVKETCQLTPVGPFDGVLTFKSSKPSVAAVDGEGNVMAKKAGKATITALVDGAAAAKCAVTVKKAPGKLSLNVKKATLEAGETLELRAKLPSGTASHAIAWSCDDPSVATVDDDGLVTAVGAGKASVTAETYNGRKATCVVTVSGSRPACRALVVGQVKYDDPLTATAGDAKHMAKLLGRVRGAAGGKFQVTRRNNLSASGLLGAIRSAFADATESDVSLFYISSHGDSESTGAYAGALAMIPGGFVTMGELADALRAVPGRVIVIIDACGSGAGVYAGDGEQNDGSAARDAARVFDHAVVDAFAAADEGVTVRSNTGELRVANKFYVLTAARYQEESWCSDTSSLFTDWLVEGVGTSGDMPADANSDGVATLNELFTYISKVGDHYRIEYREPGGRTAVAYQHVQVYPKNSGYGLFRR